MTVKKLECWNVKGIVHNEIFYLLYTSFQALFTRWWQLIYFYVHPSLGKISNLTNIFQMGGSTTNQY